MKKQKNRVRAKFPESYIKLCLTLPRGIESDFGSPYAKGQYCVYKDNLKPVYRVEQSGVECSYIVYGRSGRYEKTSDLTWIPTISEIQKELCLIKCGIGVRYGNFVKYPKDYEYSQVELRQFPSKEEKWLLLGMREGSQKVFKGKRWIPSKRQ